MHTLTTIVLPIMLGILYAVGAWVRYDAWRNTKAFHVWSVLVGIVCALSYSLSYVWLLLNGDSPSRTAALRFVATLSASVVWIWIPWQAASRAKVQEKVVKQLSS